MIQVYLNTYHKASEIIVAICDADLLGCCFKEGKFRLAINENFYGGKLVSIDKAINALENATIGNIVGVKIVKAAIKAGLIHKDGVLRVEGIPHAQRVTL
jgi:hypothetical protein